MTKKFFLSINNSTKEFLPEEKLAEFIKEQKFASRYKLQIFSLFLETDTYTLYLYCKNYNIPLKKLKEYYEKFIKPHYSLKHLEEFFEAWKV